LLKALNDNACNTERKGCFVINTSNEFLPFDKEIEAHVVNNQKTIKSIFTNFIDQGSDNNKKGASSNIASLIFTIYNGLQVISKVDQDEQEIMRSIDTVLELI